MAAGIIGRPVKPESFILELLKYYNNNYRIVACSVPREAESRISGGRSLRSS